MLSPDELLVRTRNSSGEEIANVSFLYDDIVHAVTKYNSSCINSATDRRGYVLEHMGVDHGRDGGTIKSPQNLERGNCPPDFVMLQNFKHQITCITM